MLSCRASITDLLSYSPWILISSEMKRRTKQNPTLEAMMNPGVKTEISDYVSGEGQYLDSI
jgi:hypothetical protein